ncbi:MAG TPA: cation:dicarboxylase symporter family transporter [Pyrinomonadaceae bacterium]|jgi:proton glutamate symport protein|nr:cation:dicarboxylase symporter family transporter [Pyrinomonadaceae bacterium]
MKLPKVSLTWKIMIGLVVGIFTGWLIRELDLTSPNHHVFGIETASILAFIRSLSTLFLNLIKSIIAPLIFATLVVGIAGTGDIKQVGRIGAKSLLYFEIVTTLALFIGLAAVNITRPGDGVSLAGVHTGEDKATLAQRAQAFSKEAEEAADKAADLRARAATDPGAAAEAAAQSALASQKAAEAADAAAKGLTAAEPPGKPQSFAEIIGHLSPTSIIKAMADGDVLGIVVFSVIFALAVTAIGKKAKPVVDWCQSLSDIMFRFTEYVMMFAPIGVGAAMAYTVGHNEQGLGVLLYLGKLVLTLYGALIAFAAIVLLPIALIFKVPLKDFFNAVKTPASIAFATTSSESALPKAMENLARLGVPRRIVGFVLPTGYSFNLDGTTLYLALASIFVAQAAGVELSWTQQIVMLLTLMLTSKGVAGVPRASLVILLGTLASFALPVEGVILILGVDELMDMARTAINVIGNCLATVVVAKWEGAFRNEEWRREEAELEEVIGQPAIVAA